MADSTDLVQPAPRRRRRFIILTVILVNLAVIVSIFSRIENWQRDLSQNQASLDPDATDPLLRPPMFDSPPDDVVARIRKWVEAQPQWEYVSTSEEGPTVVLKLTRRTKLFRFVDDVQVRIEPQDDQTRVDAESRSRIGKGDLGQNPRNLRELVGGITSGV